MCIRTGGDKDPVLARCFLNDHYGCAGRFNFDDSYVSCVDAVAFKPTLEAVSKLVIADSTDHADVDKGFSTDSMEGSRS